MAEQTYWWESSEPHKDVFAVQRALERQQGHRTIDDLRN